MNPADIPFTERRASQDAHKAAETAWHAVNGGPYAPPLPHPLTDRTGGTTTTTATMGSWAIALREVRGMYEAFADRLYAEWPDSGSLARYSADRWTLRHGQDGVTTWGYYDHAGQFVPIAHVGSPDGLRDLGRRLYNRVN